MNSDARSKNCEFRSSYAEPRSQKRGFRTMDSEPRIQSRKGRTSNKGVTEAFTIPCPSTRESLSIREGFRALNRGDCLAIAGPISGQEMFLNLCTKFSLKPLEMIQDVVTRWGSARDMLERALYLHKTIDAFCQRLTFLGSPV